METYEKGRPTDTLSLVGKPRLRISAIPAQDNKVLLPTETCQVQSMDCTCRLYRPAYGNEIQAIRRRLQWALREFGVAGEFDYAIINDRLDDAVKVLAGICLAEHHKSKRMKPRLDTIREGFQQHLEEDFSQ